MPAAEFWSTALIILAVASMVVGNVLALTQVNIKRMLAFSSIAHAGYILLAIVAGTGDAVNAMALYLLAYTFMNIGAFAVVIYLEGGDLITDYNGLSHTHPVIAAIMLVFMFSLAGIPPTAGFTAKFSLFMAVIQAGHPWLVVTALLMSVVSAYYYLRIVMNMYMKPATRAIEPTPNLGVAAALILSVMMVFVIGILPSAILP
jgi:NADH-quinone oxidoreductase subunit N